MGPKAKPAVPALVQSVRKVSWKYYYEIFDALRTIDPVPQNRYSMNEYQVIAEFAIPKARQMDVVDRIAHGFWNVDDYGTCTIWFPKRELRIRRIG